MTRSFARQSSNKSRRHVGIPIPSFSDNILVEPAEVSKLDPPFAPLLPVETFVLAEGSIRTFLVARKRTFLKIQTEWIPLVQTLPVSIQQKMPNFAETLLVQLLSLQSTPLQALYSLTDDKLTLGPYNGGDRVLELRRLALLPIALEKYHQVEAQVQNQLAKKKNESNGSLTHQSTISKHGISSNSKKRSVQEILNHLPLQGNDTNSSSVSTTMMTLEERVAARAHAKKERSKDTLSDMNQSHQDLLLKVADALWTHSRHILLRQSRLRTSMLSNQSPLQHIPQPCVMLMRDIVQLVSHLGSRTQVISSVKELQQRLPQWIVFSDPVVQKTTTVWIHEIPNYQEVRHALQSPNAKPDTQWQAMTTTAAAAKNEDYVVASTSSLLKRKSPPPTARNLTSILNKVQKTADSLATSIPPVSRKTTGMAIVPTNMIPAATTNTRSSTISTPNKSNTSPITTTAATRSEKKREAKNSSTTVTTKMDDIEEPVRKKFRQQLRINHHLILTDADHDGGEIIIPTGESPRGLKRLFHRMNSGQRI